MSEHGGSTRYWADWFWKRAGGRPSLPADIGYAAMCALEVYVEQVDNLTTVTAASRIEGVGIRRPAGVSERRIHGCLAVGRRGAAILVEESDNAAQKRFTIAHECAHFILEVRTNQKRAAIRLGPDFSRVLHGLREATPTERIDARLNNVRSDALVHFMDRTAAGGYGCGRIHEAECLADDLAVEILAPRSELIKSLSSFGPMDFSESLSAARRTAKRRFGLPETIADWYANRVVWQLKGGPSSAERFGFGRWSSPQSSVVFSAADGNRTSNDDGKQSCRKHE
ncbi:MAG: ImmA/IrrE family metallo-endopeptidase [Chloroflexi bacterium]|nr:ImmA/IrrE family metallo-endopeptidase [Chloroflexota bacterium]